MKNMIKMSLVAAVAVAGLSSTVAAKPLEEAIKNVDVSGMIRLRFESDNDGTDNANTTTSRDFDTEITLKNKISDDSMAVIKVEGDSDQNDNSANSSRLNANISLAYLQTKMASATVSVGRQGIPGPFDDAAGGDGIIASIPVGPVSLVAGFFQTTSISTTGIVGRDAYELALLGKMDMLSYDVFYANVAGAVSLTSVHGAAKVGPVSVDARWTKGTLDDELATTNQDATLTKITASAKAGMVNLMAGVAVTGDDNDANGGSNRIALDDDNDAGSDLKVYQASVGALADATAFLIAADVNIDKVNVGAKYVTVDYDNAADVEKTADELLVSAAYKLDTNLVVSGFYSIYNDGSVGAKDEDSTRLEVKYTF